MKAKTIYESLEDDWQIAQDDAHAEWAVSMDVYVCNDSGEIDFEECVFEENTPERFFDDSDFMQRLRWSLDELDLEDMPSFIELKDYVDLAKLFRFLYDHEMCYTNIICAMPVETYYALYDIFYDENEEENFF